MGVTALAYVYKIGMATIIISLAGLAIAEEMPKTIAGLDDMPCTIINSPPWEASAVSIRGEMCNKVGTPDSTVAKMSVSRRGRNFEEGELMGKERKDREWYKIPAK